MYEEIKGRPLFLISEELGIEREPPRANFANAGERREG
jgi:hypothetical protein